MGDSLTLETAEEDELWRALFVGHLLGGVEFYAADGLASAAVAIYR